GVDLVVSGGTEAPIGPYALTCQLTNKLMSTRTDPAEAYRPFDARANGYVPGEGGAILIVEELEFARQRGAPRIYGEIVGYGATNDAYHYSRPAPDGRQFARAMSIALKNASIGPEQVDAIIADAAGTPQGDALEAAAIRQVFGDGAAQVPVTAPKSTVGRLYGGGAPLDVAAALLAMRDQCLPPTINLDEPAGGIDLNLVTGEARSAQLNHVLVNARGYGGFNSALVLRRYEA
ncbi:MAG: ketosynthase chain-length factor, partial [Chloroflexi bacterium]|nr:ketosynthase chain-length factor [Chloroflexota bacterium]